MVTLGISCAVSPHESIDRMVDLAQRAEQGGIEALWMLDSQTLYQEVYVALAVLARETERVHLGPGVSNLLTRDLTVVASAVATLDRVSEGRVIAGFGTGDSSVRPLGLRPMRIAELSDGIGRLRSLLRGERLENPRGGTYKVSTTLDRALDIYVAGTQQRMLEACGAVGDGVVIVGPADAASVQDQLRWIDEGAKAAGRDPKSVKRDLWVGLSIGEGSQPVDDLRSYASTQARMLAHREDLPPSLEPFRAEMVEAAKRYDYRQHLRVRASHGHHLSDEFTKRVAIAGTMAECRERLTELASLPLDQLSVTLLPGGRERRLEQLVDLWGDVPQGA